MNAWDAEQYLKFQSERTQPAIDLVNRIQKTAPESVLDVGCGPGNSTQVLSQRFPDAFILGIDNDQSMIQKAREKYPRLSFELCNAGEGFPGINQKFDVVFSNACIQWIPNHSVLLRNMMNLLKKDGILAVQIPMNTLEPIHQIIKTVASGTKWSAYFPNPRIFYQLSPEGYFDLLSEISSDFQMWSTTYFHRMPSQESILDWYRGTGLRPYLSALPEEKRSEFENELFSEIIKAYPKQKNGEIIFRFPRFFFLAYR